MIGRPPPATGPAAAGRPWLAPPGGNLDHPTVAGWRGALDAGPATAAALARQAVQSLAVPPDLAPGVSVVVVVVGEPAGLEPCLQSLADQTIARDQLDIVVVIADRHRAGAEPAVGRLRRAGTPVRVVRLGRSGGSYQAGIAAAGRRYLTFVDGRDTVSPSFVETLLAYAGPHTAPVAVVVDPAPAGEPAPDAGLPSPEGGLIATNLARAIARRPGHLDEEPGLYWAAASADQQVAFQQCPAAASYYRSPRSPPAGEPAPTLEQVLGSLDLVAELERLAGMTDPDRSGPLWRRIEELTDRIGDHLRQHPGDHPAVVRALDRTPIFNLPYRRMNRGLGRGLVVAYAFPPYADTSGTVMAKRIRQRGMVADVVYNTMDRIRKQDPTIRRISGPYTCDEAAIATPTYFSHWPSMEKFTMAGIRQIQDWTAATGPYPWLYSRAHFAASHILAAAYKISHPAVAWTAEFSDPLSRGRMDEEVGTPIADGPVLTTLRAGLRQLGLPEPKSTNCFVWCEEVAYALADELIFTNENQLDYMLSYCADPDLAGIARKKAVVSPHPTLPEQFYTMAAADYPLEAGVAHLAYFGVFYATRGLDDVLTAVAESDPPTREQVRVHVFTSQPEPLRDRAAELGIGSLVRVGGYVDYLAFLNLTTRFDCLVVNDAATSEYHTRNPYLPSKWSDYRGSRTPVWGLVEAGSPLSHQPLAYRSPVGDIEAAKQVLSRIVRSKTSHP